MTLTKVLVNQIPPEAEVLLCCLRTHLDAPATERIQTLLQQKLDWAYLLQMAQKHRVVPLLYRSLNITCQKSVPLHTFHKLQGLFFENTHNNFIITQELLRLLPKFQKQGMRAIPYKGTVLAASVYGKISFRQVWDLDFLVSEQDFPRSRDLLIFEGYQLKEAFDREQAFFHAQKKVEVDLHWGLTPFYFPLKIDFEGLWQRRKPVALAGTTVFSFSPEDMLLILCVQVAKDCWERRQHLEHLAKVCDIAELLREYPALDWQQILERSNSLGARRMLYFGLFLAKNLLNATLPESIRLAIRSDNVVTSLAQQVCYGLFGELDRDFPPLSNSLLDLRLRFKQLIFYLKMRERPEHKLKHIWEIFKTLGAIITVQLQTKENNAIKKQA